MTTYIIAGLIFIIVFGISIASKLNSQPKEKQASKKHNGVTTNQLKQQENPFNEMRNIALKVTPDQIGIKNLGARTKVYGIVMDWDIGNGIATLVSYETGDASMYLSSGGGIIGGGQHENVNQAVLQYLKLGQEFLTKAKKTDKTPLPDKNCVRFYFLTQHGTFTAQEKMKNIEDKNSLWLKLFEEANKVITELRLTTEKK